MKNGQQPEDHDDQDDQVEKYLTPRLRVSANGNFNGTVSGTMNGDHSKSQGSKSQASNMSEHEMQVSDLINKKYAIEYKLDKKICKKAELILQSYL